jgi:homoserine kinase
VAIELEGHPDNVVPALLGGCRLAASNAPPQPPLSKGGLREEFPLREAGLTEQLPLDLDAEILPSPPRSLGGQGGFLADLRYSLASEYCARGSHSRF